MKLIKSSINIIKQPSGLNGIYQHIEKCGRVSYQSYDKMTEDSYSKFCNMLRTRGHLAPFEHGSVYLRFPFTGESKHRNHHPRGEFYATNPYSRVKYALGGTDCFVSTNMRVIIENNLEDDLLYLSDITEYHTRRHTVILSCDISVTREGNRHRVNSIVEESTRYCNYSKNKFGNEITIVEPEELQNSQNFLTTWEFNNKTPLQNMCQRIYQGDDEFTIVDNFLFANLACEYSYMNLLNLGWTPQQARRVLPLDLHTQVAYTAFEDDWEHFFKLRCAPDAHPDIRKLAIEIQNAIND